MLNEKLLRPAVFIIAAVLHVLVLLFLAFNVNQLAQEDPENARIMKLVDLDEAPPPPPEEEVIPQVETIAETMIETDTPPVQQVVAAGTLTIVTTPTHNFEDDYLPMHKISVRPEFDQNAIASDLVYPPIALRAGIEGRVILELFVDLTGTIQRIRIMLEEPEDRGFGEAAVKAFTGKKGTPAMANNEPVSARIRWPVTFKIK
jgi:protein TonB